jgi:hypothetical protein
MALAKLCFLGIVRAKLRTEVFAIGCAPDFDVTIAENERLVAERAASEIAALEVLAARDHASLHRSRTCVSSPEKIEPALK